MIPDDAFLTRWFTEVCRPQLNRYNQRMSDAQPYRGAPKWERMRQAAQSEFHSSVADARELYETAMAELLANEEITEATEYALAQFKVSQIFQIAAE